MADLIEMLGASIIQHGKENDRIYLMKLANKDADDIVMRLDELTAQNKYTKIFAKVPAYAKQRFLDAEYRVEAHVPRFFNGATTAFSWENIFPIHGNMSIANNALTKFSPYALPIAISAAGRCSPKDTIGAS